MNKNDRMKAKAVHNAAFFIFAYFNIKLSKMANTVTVNHCHSLCEQC